MKQVISKSEVPKHIKDEIVKIFTDDYIFIVDPDHTGKIIIRDPKSKYSLSETIK
jgi:hypothetical protein